MKKRLVHCSTAHPRNDIRILVKECNSLSTAGYEVYFVVADGKGNERVGDVTVVDSGSSVGRLDRMFWSTWRVYKKALALNGDLYHLHDPELLPVALCLKRNGKRVVFDSHEDVPKQILGKHYLPPFVRQALSHVFARFERYACSRLDGIVAATPHIRDKFMEINRRTIDINNFPIVGELETDSFFTGTKNEVCYIGAIAGVRGVRELVSAMALTRPGVRLNLVGEFAEVGVEAEVKALSGWQRVNALGVQDRRGVAAVLGRSVAGLVNLHPLPNYLDALPIKMFEYMSVGVPVIASNFELWKQIVEGSGCGICIDPLDPIAIAKAIDYLVEHPDEARKMGENGRQAVLSHYNWAREEEKLIDFYAEVLG